jgi:hypothetical protein
MNFEDLQTTPEIGPRHNNPPVKSARPQQSWIQHVRAIRRRDQDDTLVSLEAIHLDQELIQSLLALVVTSAHSGASMPTHRVDFIDEYDAGRLLFSLLKKVSNPGRAHAYKHLDKV